MDAVLRRDQGLLRQPAPEDDAGHAVADHVSRLRVRVDDNTRHLTAADVGSRNAVLVASVTLQHIDDRKPDRANVDENASTGRTVMGVPGRVDLGEACSAGANEVFDHNRPHDRPAYPKAGRVE